MNTARMTGTAWGRGLLNALICSLGIIVVLALATAVSMFVFEQSFSSSLVISYVVL